MDACYYCFVISIEKNLGFLDFYSNPLIRAGFTFRKKWLDLTSMVSYIAKSNNIDQQNLTKPGTSESKTVLLIYDIQTIGWTTSAEIDPFFLPLSDCCLFNEKKANR